MKPKILLIEDEIKTAITLQKGLEEFYYDTDIANDGEEGINKARNKSYDLIITDLMMPVMNGIDFCFLLRKEGINIPVLILTALGTIDDKTVGFESGADDYLVKPFNLEELLLRVKILLGRNKKTQIVAEGYSFGEFKINFKTYEIFEKDKKIAELGYREIQLLKLLIDKENQVVSREEILDLIWGEDTFPTSRTIDNYILIFRKYFEKNPREPRYFHSVRGVGYKFTS